MTLRIELGTTRAKVEGIGAHAAERVQAELERLLGKAVTVREVREAHCYPQPQREQ